MSVPEHLPPDVRKIDVFAVTGYRGDGSADNPEREVYAYYDAATGNLLACHDPLNGPPGWFQRPCPQQEPGQKAIVVQGVDIQSSGAEIREHVFDPSGANP
jgi:hypothetical protein